MFLVLAFTIPSGGIDILEIFFLIIGILILLGILIRFLFPENSIAKIFDSQSTLMKIILIVFVVIALYGLITLENLKIIGAVIFLIIVFLFAEWFFKKEE